MVRAFMTDADRDDVASFIECHWGSRMVMSQGQQYYPHEYEALIERENGRIVGLITFRTDHKGIELLTLNSTVTGRRIGTSLILEVMEHARKNNISRLWLTTTNDNMRAIGLYQRLGFRISAVNAGAVDEARKIKPQIPEIGKDGIPIRDEIVMTLDIEPYLSDAGRTN